jgi:hypothetical protein
MRLLLCMLLAITSAKAQEDFERVLQLSRTRQKMAKNLDHLPDYTCLATVDRSAQSPGQSKYKIIDTLRFEITHAGGTELWSWPGAKKFEDKPFVNMIQSGAIGQGEFSLHARAVFVNGYANVKFGGSEDIGGRHALRWDYTIPRFGSGWEITADGQSTAAASRGSFWADADTLEVVRLEVRSEGLPLDFPISSVVTTIDYAQVRVGSSSVLPQTARLYLEHSSGERRLNSTEFSNCKQYSGSSVILFDRDP